MKTGIRAGEVTKKSSKIGLLYRSRSRSNFTPTFSKEKSISARRKQIRPSGTKDKLNKNTVPSVSKGCRNDLLLKQTEEIIKEQKLRLEELKDHIEDISLNYLAPLKFSLLSLSRKANAIMSGKELRTKKASKMKKGLTGTLTKDEPVQIQLQVDAIADDDTTEVQTWMQDPPTVEESEEVNKLQFCVFHFSLDVANRPQNSFFLCLIILD